MCPPERSGFPTCGGWSTSCDTRLRVVRVLGIQRGVQLCQNKKAKSLTLCAEPPPPPTPHRPPSAGVEVHNYTETPPKWAVVRAFPGRVARQAVYCTHRMQPRLRGGYAAFCRMRECRTRRFGLPCQTHTISASPQSRSSQCYGVSNPRLQCHTHAPHHPHTPAPECPPDPCITRPPPPPPRHWAASQQHPWPLSHPRVGV